MEIKITIVGLDQLTEALALIGSSLAFQRGMVPTEKAAVQLMNEVAAEEVKEVEEVEEVKEVKEEVISIEEVRAAFMAKNSKGNTPKLKEILKEFNVAKVTDLDEKDFADVLAKLEAI